MPHQQPDGAVGDGQHPALLLGDLVHQKPRQIGNVLRALAQGRHENRHHVEPVIQVLAKLAGLHRRFQVAVGGGDDPHVHPQGLAAAEPLQLAFLQHPQQLGLKLRRNIADLVQEQSAAVGLLEAALALVDRAGERPLLVPEQLRFQQVVRQRRAVQLEQRPAGARRVVVDGAGDQLLAGAGFAPHQHRGVPLRHLPHLLEHPLHRLAVADHAVEAVLAAHRAPQAVALGGQRAALAFRLAGGLHAAGDQVGDHLQKAGALLQPLVAAGRLRRQHPAVLLGTGPDRHADERQFPVVQSQAIEKARFVGDARQHHLFAALQHHPQQAFARQIAHRLVVRERVLAVDRVDQQGAAVRVHQRDHAVQQFAPVVQHLQDPRERVFQRTGLAENPAHPEQGRQLDFQQFRTIHEGVSSAAVRRLRCI